MPKHLPTPTLPEAAFHKPSAPRNASPASITVSTKTISRRLLLLWGLTIGVIACRKAANASALNDTALPTPRQSEGPFYPDQDQRDKDNDLTRIEGGSRTAHGEVIIVQGQVIDTSGNALDKAFVEIWQANTWGRYRHQGDPNAAPLDPDFQGWGQTRTDAQGGYRFKTIKPGAYPAGPGWTRPPHIHFKVSSPGYFPLTTQMYFPNQRLNSEDLILQNVPLAQRSMVIAQRQSEKKGESIYRFDIVLMKNPG